MKNATKEIRKLAEENDGKLPFYAWPGCYPLYYIDKENNVLCPECANNYDEYSEPLVDYDVYWEGPPMTCDNCGKEIESAYGDPDEEAIQ